MKSKKYNLLQNEYFSKCLTLLPVEWCPSKYSLSLTPNHFCCTKLANKYTLTKHYFYFLQILKNIGWRGYVWYFLLLAAAKPTTEIIKIMDSTLHNNSFLLPKLPEFVEWLRRAFQPRPSDPNVHFLIAMLILGPDSPHSHLARSYQQETIFSTLQFENLKKVKVIIISVFS